MVLMEPGVYCSEVDVSERPTGIIEVDLCGRQIILDIDAKTATLVSKIDEPVVHKITKITDGSVSFERFRLHG